MPARKPKRRLPLCGHWHVAYISLMLLAACSAVSCRQHSGPIAQEQTNLSWLGSMYGMYIGAHQGQPPQTIEDLRKFVAERTSTEELSRLNVRDVKELFISPRDGKPFDMVIYKKLPPPAGGQPSPVVLYEAAGQSGQRAVAFLGGVTQVVNESELSQLLPESSRTR